MPPCRRQTQVVLYGSSNLRYLSGYVRIRQDTPCRRQTRVVLHELMVLGLILLLSSSTFLCSTPSCTTVFVLSLLALPVQKYTY